jgi:hypothetical protein
VTEETAAARGRVARACSLQAASRYIAAQEHCNDRGDFG